MGWSEVVGSVAGLAGVGSGVFFTYKAKTKEVDKSNEQQMIDQLQDAQKTSEERLRLLEEKVDKLLKRDTLSRQFIWKLISHINTSQGPPAPDWPEDLL